MCGRFYLDDEMLGEMSRVTGEIQFYLEDDGFQEIYPTDEVPVIYGSNGKLTSKAFAWGFPDYNDIGFMINAKSESVRDDDMFRESIDQRRCVVPAAGFYLWNQEKGKVAFKDKKGPILYLAGFYKAFENINRFVIVTTVSGYSAAQIHARMPLVLREEEIEKWIFDPEAYRYMMQKIPPRLMGI